MSDTFFSRLQEKTGDGSQEGRVWRPPKTAPENGTPGTRHAEETVSGRAAEALATKGEYRGDHYVPLLGEGRVQYFEAPQPTPFWQY